MKPHPKERLVVVVPSKTYSISKCFHECPYFELEGGPSPMMVCGHPTFKSNPDPYAGCIISHPECDKGFPAKCPLRGSNG